ncbi:RlpA-like double-psi beta-barrel-protein domain-containing protein-containing protein [Cladorrhinum sp. PSN259]|nr:RlpA-like double-psi beta-barrel-protein domain-containing protein-containing protein [Cladorrhinum sp. PSN259]
MASPITTTTTTPARRPTAEMDRIRHVPDWEIPVNPPKRKKKSFFSRFMPSSSSSYYSERKFPTLPLFTRSSNRSPPHTPVAGGQLPTTSSTSHITKEIGHAPSRTTTFQSSTPPENTLKSRFNTVFPPQKRYCCGRLTRRIFFLLLVLLILIFALALGLGLGLGLRHKTSSLPLPWNKAGSSVQKGELTYFSPSVGLGACGQVYSDNDTIAAVGHELFDGAAKDRKVGVNNPNANPLCGMSIRVMRGDGRREVEVRVVDRCTGCGARDLDLSLGAFDEIGEMDEGRVEGKWEWVR